MTNKTAWTPGPWHVGVRQAEQIVYNTSGWAIANATVYHGKHDLEETKANARLIALAPEMAEALREIEDTAHCAAGCHDDVMQGALEECRVLARAILSRLPEAK